MIITVEKSLVINQCCSCDNPFIYKMKKLPTYNFDLDKAFIAALSICIILFYLSPRVAAISTPKHNPPVIRIDVVDIPQTNQTQPVRPRPQKPLVSALSEEVDILDDVEIQSEEYDIKAASGINDIVQAIEKLPVQPRQILEVVPQNKNENLQGKITLKLRIGMDGTVKEERILLDTIKDSDCLKQVLTAARNSRWQPIQLKGQKVEYWVEKSYIFE